MKGMETFIYKPMLDI